jgi:PPM family protein phosphatase
MFWDKLFAKKEKDPPTENKSEIIDSGNIKVVIQSDLGNIRTNNEDNAVFFKIADEKILQEKGYLLMVADGMGGHQAGEVASGMSVDIICKEYFRQNNDGAVEKNLARAFSFANKKIFELSSQNRAYQGMGTTCTVLIVIDQSVYYGQVGDSRAYVLKNNLFLRITEDQTYVQELVNSGDITPEEAEVHPKRNILTNAMGTKPDLRIETGKCDFSFEQGDKLLLCSDGLYDYLKDGELAEALDHMPLQEAASHMIAEAKKRGGHDNITVLLAEKTAAIKVTTSKETRDFDLPQTKEYDLP